MGQTSPARELGQARIEYIAAVREWANVLAAYVVQAPPLDSRTGEDLPAWSRDDVQLMLALQRALNRLVDTRRAYDRTRPPRR